MYVDEFKSGYEQDYSSVYEKLNINEQVLPDLQKYYEIAKKRASACNKSWGSPERYVNALYWMKFVKKYDWREISEIIGNNYISVRYNYAPFGWYNEFQTLEECEEYVKNIRDSISEALAEIDDDSSVFDREDYQGNPFCNDNTIVHHKTRDTFNVNEEKDLFKILFYLLRIKEFPTYSIALYYNTTAGNLRKYLKKYNIGLSRKESRERIEASNRGNHVKARVAFNKKKIRQSLEFGLSNEYELLFRDLFSQYILDYLNENDYESIIGIQTFSIVPPLEIDIPIIIFHKETKVCYKYAVELNGEIWHNSNKAKKRDTNKKGMIEKTDWKLITINFDKSVSSPNLVKKAFIRLTHEICAIIQNDVRNNGCDNWKTIEIAGFSDDESFADD